MSEEKRVAVVTGGERGIGRGITDQLLKDGYYVVIANRSKEAGEKAVAELNAQGYEGKVVAVAGDASQKESHQRFVQAAVDNFGRLDTYINNADMDEIFHTNVYSVLYGIQAATDQFRKQDDGDKIRKIINASSIAGHIAFDMLGAYSATKFAIRGLTQAAAKELGREKITVNAYCPGIVGTDMWDYIDEKMVDAWGGNKGDYLKKYSGSITMGRVETPADVANYVSYLASSASDYMTGQAVQIDGGIQFI